MAASLADEPILTPQHTLALRGVDVTTVRFDLAVFCFRGPLASRLVIEALGAGKAEWPLLYGIPCHSATIDGLRVVVLPQVIYGGPVTAILLEELACLGVKTAIGVGAAGSLISDAHVGQVFIAERAAVQDGTSREYSRSNSHEAWANPNPQLLELTQALAARENAIPLPGAVWTTDALYQERPSSVACWRQAGADLVNLECGPFYAVARAVGIRAVYLGLVTDHVSAERGWQAKHWGRKSAADPLIMRVVCGIADAMAREEHSHV